MTKEITKAIILQEIQDKFQLREFAPSPFLFDETVVPVYNIEEHLKHWEVKTNTVSITSATDFFFFLVPTNERWTLRSYMFIFHAAGAYTVSGLYVKNRPTVSTNYIYLDLEAGQSASYLVNLPVPVVLEPDNRLHVLVDGYTSTADLEILMDVQKEEIR